MNIKIFKSYTNYLDKEGCIGNTMQQIRSNVINLKKKGQENQEFDKKRFDNFFRCVSTSF